MTNKENKKTGPVQITGLMKKKRLYFDGGMGTLLQEKGLKAGEAPESIDDITLADAKWSAFLTEKGIKDPATTTGEGDAWTTDSETLYNTWNVSYYKGGVCYLPYFIRHEDNGVPSQMGPMEYCIVRNNVYQVAVTGVNALGYPLPFITPGDTPVEEENVFLQVQIWVKDWTLRTNGGIIL